MLTGFLLGTAIICFINFGFGIGYPKRWAYAGFGLIALELIYIFLYRFGYLPG